jgi:hypothetical protein
MKPKEKIYLSLSIFLLSVFLLIFFIFSLFQGIKKQSQNLLTLRQKMVEKEAELKNIQNLKSTEKEINPALEKVEKIFFNEEAPIDFINFLERISQDCQISIEKISPILPQKKATSTLSEVDFQIAGFSTFKNAVCFLEKLEFGPYLIQISNLNLSKLTEEELKAKNFQGFSLNDVKLNIVFRVYTK